jgi:hypothetical protein
MLRPHLAQILHSSPAAYATSFFFGVIINCGFHKSDLVKLTALVAGYSTLSGETTEL